MKRALALAAASAALIVACTTPAPNTAKTEPARAWRVDRGPYLQATTRHETTVCWRTTAPAPSVVHVAGESDVSATTALEKDHVVTLTNLKEGSSFTYRVEGEDLDHTAKTAPGPESGFKAVVIGDSGEGTPEQSEIARLMGKEDFDLFLHTGDIVYPNGGDKDFDIHFFAQYDSLLGAHTFWPAVGNHDRHKPENGEPYKRIFHFVANNPEGNRYYYSFTWGCAKFVSIESYGLFKQPGPHQDWLEKELASNDRKWLVLMMHVPIYSTGAHGDDKPLEARLVPLIEKYHVNLVLEGHDHLYERGHMQGWDYIVTGGGGASLYPVKTPHSWTAHTESSFHYVWLDFSKEKISGRMVRVDGTTGDRFDF